LEWIEQRLREMDPDNHHPYIVGVIESLAGNDGGRERSAERRLADIREAIAILKSVRA
jgi:hypothetical protein